MSIVLTNALLADIDPIRLETGDLRVNGEHIVERGRHLSKAPADEVIDCEGGLVLPGFVNGHTHLYSALAVGMPPPPRPPQNLLEILRFVWWRLDQALDAESIEMSARVGAMEALRCGTTTLIDHHASPNCIDGSLELIERALAGVGLRGVLCYETTDRHGHEQRMAGIQENRRYLERCRRNCCGRFAGLVGAHASFTLEDESLDRLAELADEFDTGVHIHVAEDSCDEDDARSHRGTALIERLAAHRILRAQSVFAHGTHLEPDAISRINDAGLTMAHNPRSNLCNAVGYAPIASFRCPVMLGTDGIGSDMFAEAKHAWFMSQHARARISPDDVLGMLAAAARRASASLGVTIGTLEPQSAADLVITSYRPHTPLTGENLASHFIFEMGAKDVAHVLVGGRCCLRDRRIVTVDESATRASAVGVARRLWKDMSGSPRRAPAPSARGQEHGRSTEDDEWTPS